MMAGVSHPEGTELVVPHGFRTLHVRASHRPAITGKGAPTAKRFRILSAQVHAPEPVTPGVRDCNERVGGVDGNVSGTDLAPGEAENSDDVLRVDRPRRIGEAVRHVHGAIGPHCDAGWIVP